MQQSTLPFEIKPSVVAGEGAFATRDIYPGENIGEYMGERITEDQAVERYGDQAFTMLFSLDNGYLVDGSVGGNGCEKVNHGCDPNVHAYVRKGKKRAVVYQALREIKKGEELLIDYRLNITNPREAYTKFRCNCGSGNCRGTMAFVDN